MQKQNKNKKYIKWNRIREKYIKTILFIKTSHDLLEITKKKTCLINQMYLRITVTIYMQAF